MCTLNSFEGLVKLNQTCVELPTSSSERRKWGDECYEEEADSDEDGYAQITMDFREPRSPVGSIDSDTPVVRLDANILHPRALRMLGFTTKEGLEFEGMTNALKTMFMEPADYVLAPSRPRTEMKQSERAQEGYSQTDNTERSQKGSGVSTPTYNAAGRAPETIRRNDTDEEEEEAYFESDPSEICDDDDDTEMEDDMAEATRSFEQLYMPRRITQAQWEEIEQYAEGTNKEVALHELITPRKPRRQRKPRPRYPHR
ncbi:hypothetical protein K7X08_029896 [Anisodus acutangulus]|uniref:Uncharacterized protein n=1 Tax=Anisodus acutangulus TaxID=402998 RepID=A0A9Q1R3K3_9SOLA|nr:hypothetical protein K7X08_029896 [Anisodus acutangulus]